SWRGNTPENRRWGAWLEHFSDSRATGDVKSIPDPINSRDCGGSADFVAVASEIQPRRLPLQQPGLRRVISTPFSAFQRRGAENYCSFVKTCYFFDPYGYSKEKRILPSCS